MEENTRKGEKPSTIFTLKAIVQQSTFNVNEAKAALSLQQQSPPPIPKPARTIYQPVNYFKNDRQTQRRFNELPPLRDASNNETERKSYFFLPQHSDYILQDSLLHTSFENILSKPFYFNAKRQKPLQNKVRGKEQLQLKPAETYLMQALFNGDSPSQAPCRTYNQRKIPQLTDCDVFGRAKQVKLKKVDQPDTEKIIDSSMQQLFFGEVPGSTKIIPTDPSKLEKQKRIFSASEASPYTQSQALLTKELQIPKTINNNGAVVDSGTNRSLIKKLQTIVDELSKDNLEIDYRLQIVDEIQGSLVYRMKELERKFSQLKGLLDCNSLLLNESNDRDCLMNISKIEVDYSSLSQPPVVSFSQRPAVSFSANQAKAQIAETEEPINSLSSLPMNDMRLLSDYCSLSQTKSAYSPTKSTSNQFKIHKIICDDDTENSQRKETQTTVTASSTSFAESLNSKSALDKASVMFEDIGGEVSPLEETRDEQQHNIHSASRSRLTPATVIDEKVDSKLLKRKETPSFHQQFPAASFPVNEQDRIPLKPRNVLRDLDTFSQMTKEKPQKKTRELTRIALEKTESLLQICRTSTPCSVS